MIISRTPLRVSFAGGGTDLRSFYSSEQGAVTSTAINKYIYISAHKIFENRIILKYSKSENVKNVDDIKQPLLREALRMTGIVRGIEIATLSDVPAGTGLGGSSSYVVGLLNTLYAYKGEHVSSDKLAREAAEIEIDILKDPIGKQDHYIAAYGGINHIQFNRDETVFVNPLLIPKDIKRQLQENLMMFYTGVTRKASSILSKQKGITPNNKEKFASLVKMRELSNDITNALKNRDLRLFGELLHKGWLHKKSLVSGISNPLIDKYYEDARKAGAIGGKLLGAGGGGFMLFYCEKERQDKVRKEMGDLKELHFEFEPQGSKIIYVSE